MPRWPAAFIQAMNNYLVTNTQEALLYQQYSIYRLRDKAVKEITLPAKDDRKC